MAKYAVSDKGVQALKTTASNILEAVEQVLNIVDSLELTADENVDTLGPHHASLASALSEIRESQKQAVQHASELSEALNDIADAYQDIIDNDRISTSTGAARGLFATAAFGAVIGTMGGNSQKYKAVRRDLSDKIPNSLLEANDFGSLSNYMDSRYGIKLDSSMKHLDLGTVKGAISGVESVINEYPEIGELLKTGITSKSGVMSCTGSKLSFNPDYFGDDRTLSETCKNMSDSGFWVSNSSPDSIGAHEAAHGVEWALIQANPDYTNDYERVHAWNQCSEAGKIVSQACDNIKKTPYGQGKNQAELIQSISKYGMKDDSETMAEAFADVYANGEKASPLSKEIKRITKKQMDRYKGVLLC